MSEVEKRIVISSLGIMRLVRYPSRKSPDLYMAVGGHPMFCIQCSTDFFSTLADLAEHIERHAPRRDRLLAHNIRLACAHDYEPGDEFVL